MYRLSRMLESLLSGFDEVHFYQGVRNYECTVFAIFISRETGEAPMFQFEFEAALFTLT